MPPLNTPRTPGTSARAGTVLGVDSGGSGLRAALAPAGAPGEAVAVSGSQPVRTSARGIDAGHFLELLLPLVRELRERVAPEGEPPVAVAVGAAGMATLGDDLRATLPGALAAQGMTGPLALAADAVTAYTGALGVRPGAVVAVGTGMIALGTDLRDWRRADGWGHLLGDSGGGAWLGRAGLEAAYRAFDGRAGGSQALLAAAEERFGPLPGLPAQLYPRPDRAAVLASFAPDVARCAGEGDPTAAALLTGAASHVVDAVEAVLPGREGEVACTGGLLRLGTPLTEPVGEELARRLPGARVVPAAGDPLHGAVVLASALASGAQALPVDGRLLWCATSASGPGGVEI
ncbi:MULTISPECIES: BadF/BadG/BcrA/BcrD ATPase family protein [unclassified Streptomyces]|uniref:N-acetylglucosamine kinase n=1 Tax=Streptomyces TaxID=1883 RepID=UPI0016477FFE|nr:BadF/BadG/BcrA/BcrD ATPase family protein [Streptomyces sp. CBG33]